ncbi:CPBP family intramembrane metalloprotease [Streptococcus intermedius]|uniref:CPBP family intramembrane metalloprotease n=1 Tax=Streptococcus intermedius TaxID=1338 RepID=UPI0020014121|nr:CPBP family intramembrane metalloprotease [Streptococcus intermedius]MDK8091804.1 CPBP family intramembrane metalloprotease [Streptococcus intermedius]
MRKIKNILQMSLLIVLTQITLVLLTTPLPKSLSFQQSSFVFLFILFFAGLLYFRYFSRELTDFKSELLTNHYWSLLRLSYLMMVFINAIGAYLMILEGMVVASEGQQLLLSLFVHSSLFLLGVDIVALVPEVRSSIIHFLVSKGQARTSFVIGSLLFILLRNPAGLTCFIIYTGLGCLLSLFIPKSLLRLEFSIFSHLVRNSFSLFFLLFFW